MLNNYLPKAWFTSQQLIEHFAGETLFACGATNITAPSTWEPFADVHMMLNGRGAVVGVSAGAWLNDKCGDEGFLGTWDLRISSGDYIKITSTGEAFYILADAGANVWGMLNNEEFESTLVNGVHTVTIPRDWTRGTFDAQATKFYITGTTSTAELNFKLPNGGYQGVPEVCWNTLEVMDEDSEGRPTDNVTQRLATITADAEAGRLYLNDSGKVRIVLKTTLTSPALTTAFLQWCGFDGTETFANEPTGALGEPNYKAATANGYPTGLLILDRPLDQIEPHVYTEGSGEVLSDGRKEWSHVYTITGWDLQFTLQGRASGNDTLFTAIQQFFNYLWKTDFFTVYQDSRERRAAAAETEDYTAGITPEWNYRVGFLRLTPTLDYKGQRFPLQDPRIRQFYERVAMQCLPFIPE